ncbi:MAG: hypothetical protein EpisKO_41760 [Epibacterium sp.]
MVVRPARLQDIPQIRKLAAEAYAQSRYASGLGMDLDVLTKVLISFITLQADKPGEGLVVVGEDEEGEICSIFAGVVATLYHCLDALMASNAIWYAQRGCHPDLSLGVLDYFVDWVEQSEHPVLHRYVITDGIIDNHHAIGALLVRKRGFRLAGGVYEKGI